MLHWSQHWSQQFSICFTALHPANAFRASTTIQLPHILQLNDPTNAGEIEHAVDQTLEMKKNGAGKNGSEPGSNGNGGQEEKSEKKEDFSIQNAEDEEEAVNNAASVGAEAQIGAVVSPASVWLPYRDSNVDRNKVCLTCSGHLQILLGAHKNASRHSPESETFKNMSCLMETAI